MSMLLAHPLPVPRPAAVVTTRPTTGPTPATAGAAAGEREMALVGEARAGSAAAFEALYRQEAGRVFALALRLTGDRARAAELTQDVFVRAWERLGTFRGDAPVGLWLRRIAVTTLLSGARAERRRLSRVALADDVGAAVDAAAGPRRDVEAGVDLDRAIAALPPGARAVFVLHDVEGYAHAEIARLTGTAEGTCRAHLHRARRLLMEALGR